jgi:hypothetical protein
MQNTLPKEGIIKRRLISCGAARDSFYWMQVLVDGKSIGETAFSDASYLSIGSKKTYSITKFGINYAGEDPTIQVAFSFVPAKWKKNPQDLVIVFDRDECSRWVTYVYRKL